MAASLFAGPIISMGTMEDALSGAAQLTNPVAGVSLFYHGQGFPDVRYYPIPKDNLDNVGVIFSVYDPSTAVGVNAIPSTAGGSVGNVASPQGTTTGVALTLATNASVGITLNVPYMNFATRQLATGRLALDLGIETPTVVASSKTVTVVDSSVYRSGQPIIISQVGNVTGTAHLFTYVTGAPTSTTITIADAPASSNSTTCRIASGLPGWANSNGVTPAIRPTFYAPYIASGVALVFDETQALERGVSVTGSVGALGGNFTINGADFYGQTQTELLTLISGASTIASRKCYKIINSITPSFTNTANTYSVNTTDLFGFPFRSDLWEMLTLYVAGQSVSSSTGWTKGDKTSPATTTTGDVRGTYSLQSPSNGANRVVFFQTLPFLNSGRASPVNPTFLYGVTPV